MSPGEEEHDGPRAGHRERQQDAFGLIAERQSSHGDTEQQQHARYVEYELGRSTRLQQPSQHQQQTGPDLWRVGGGKLDSCPSVVTPQLRGLHQKNSKKLLPKET